MDGAVGSSHVGHFGAVGPGNTDCADRHDEHSEDIRSQHTAKKNDYHRIVTIGAAFNKVRIEDAVESPSISLSV